MHLSLHLGTFCFQDGFIGSSFCDPRLPGFLSVLEQDVDELDNASTTHKCLLYPCMDGSLVGKVALLLEAEHELAELGHVTGIGIPFSESGAFGE